MDTATDHEQGKGFELRYVFFLPRTAAPLSGLTAFNILNILDIFNRYRFLVKKDILNSQIVCNNYFTGAL
jgi:hypothetical protein